MLRLAVPVVLLVAGASAAEQKKVLVSMPPAQAQQLQQSFPNLRIVSASGDAWARELADADAVVGGVSPEHFGKAKKLKWIHLTSAGAERAVYPELVKSDVVLTNAKGVYGPQISDHAFALLLTLTRNMNHWREVQEKQDWPRGREGMVELAGKTAVVIGVGSIGGNIAQRAHGFGMRVIGVDIRDIAPSNVLDKVVRPDRLHSVLPEADVLFIAAPHTPKTEKMMGSDEFNLMKKGSYFISMSRGKITDTAALVKALDEGRLAGAGLDVTDPEPLPKGHALWKFPNVVITPHISGGSDNLDDRQRSLLMDNLGRFAKGEALRNEVDKAEGF
jgi:phosphoglycerate dehydrogenase-like enzyme